MTKRLLNRTLLIGIAAILLVLIAELAGILEFPELKAQDAAFNLRGAINPSTNIVIVAIDDESFRETGLHWPWGRDYIAKIVSGISQGKPKVIAIDVQFYEKFQGDEALADALKHAGNVILANDISFVNDPRFRIEQLNQPIAPLAQNAAAIGLSNFNRDPDGYARTILAYKIHQDQTYYHWAVHAAARYLDSPLPAHATPDLIPLARQPIPLDQQSLRINFRGPARTFRNIPAYQIVNGDIKPDIFQNKIVLIGATSESLHDTYPTPFRGDFQPMPGVEIGANAIETILIRNYLTEVGTGGTLVIALILGVIGLALGFVRRAGLALMLQVAAVIAYGLVWYFAFSPANLQLPLVTPEFTLILAFGAPAIERAASEEAEKRRVRGIFQRFISPEMVRQIIDQGMDASRGKRTELTMLFSDIRGFTTLSEKMAPDKLVDILNEYLETMTEVIFRHNGTVDKFEGDAIIAFWGAPTADARHAQNGVSAALEMRRELVRLRQKWGVPDPKAFEIGIGLNTGDVFVGLIGSAKRVNYTIIGDNANLAARLQDLTKEFKWPLLISAATYEKIKDEFDAEFGEERLVKGKTVPVGIYRVLGKKGAPEEERVRALFT